MVFYTFEQVTPGRSLGLLSFSNQLGFDSVRER